MGFILGIDDLRRMAIGEALEKINTSPKKPLHDLRLFDMLLTDEADMALRHGVYLFFDDRNECIYVGMCSSSHFAHRIGGHFGMSPKYGMNTFLRRVVRDLGLKEGTYDSYVEALRRIGSYSLLMIDANNTGVNFLRALERLLHTTLRPRLNFPKGFPTTYRSIHSETSVQEALIQCGNL